MIIEKQLNNLGVFFYLSLRVTKDWAESKAAAAPKKTHKKHVNEKKQQERKKTRLIKKFFFVDLVY